MTKETIHVGVGIDQNYLQPFYVLTTSIFHNNSDHNIFLHVITSNINETELIQIKSYVTQLGGRIRFYHVDNDWMLDKLKISSISQFSQAIFYRLFFPMIVPSEITKLLYLDSDVLVVGDLDELIKTDLNCQSVGAVHDKWMPLRKDLGLTSVLQYFNSGVLLIDINLWKSNHITERAIEFLTDHENEIIDFPDQDALNKILVKNWYALENRFNLMPDDIPLLKSNEEVNFVKDKTIIHYTGMVKPWSLLRVKLGVVYRNYITRFTSSEIGSTISSISIEKSLRETMSKFIGENNETGEFMIEYAFSLHLIWLRT